MADRPWTCRVRSNAVWATGSGHTNRSTSASDGRPRHHSTGCRERNLTAAVTIANGATVAITNSDALGLGGKVAGVTNAGFTTIDTLAELELDPSAGSLTVPENLIINGTGVSNLGALYNQAGNNTYSGDIELDSATTIGAAPNTTLTIGTPTGGIISDLGAPQNLSTDGGGTIVLAHPGGNTYRGTTSVNYGVLEIEDPFSLGAGAGAVSGTASGTPQDETIVNYNQTTGQAGTLEINFVAPNVTTGGLGSNYVAGVDPNGILTNYSALHLQRLDQSPTIGFQVFNDLLVLNGPGSVVWERFITSSATTAGMATSSSAASLPAIPEAFRLASTRIQKPWQTRIPT